ncbi:MAG: DUF3786 domain-containing protein [Gracilibacteraceae bacterium]|jgi:hypothetical protein|nr:DUF3786 domain-containing protein [Gracilibacteraceae bacterium]
MIQKQNQLTDTPFAHYSAIYRTLDPGEIAARTALAFDRETSSFAFTLMGEKYRASFPDFALIDAASGQTAQRSHEGILILRYLCAGKHVAATGQAVAYSEIPWGDAYLANFRHRVIARLAREFGGRLDVLRSVMETMPELCAERLEKCDLGYRFLFMSGLFAHLLFWQGDDEFPASAQILFDDNFKYAFTAEDIAVSGDIIVSRLKRMCANGKRP